MSSMENIKKNKDFVSIYRKGRSISNRQLVLYYKKNRLVESRFGISISKKVGNSVTRNRIKRIIKENLRKKYDKIKKGYDLVFIVRVGASNMNYNEAGCSIDDLLKRAGL
ncbi:MAG: ribonuclease P protein component [Clostridia bacterium]|nr:ribonuclease P protein component [Clostridia bacterium]